MQNITIITDAATEPVTLAEAKLHCRVDYDDDDSLISSYITSARQAAENVMQRSVLPQTLRLSLDEFPLPAPVARTNALVSAAIVIPRGGVQSISSLKYFDQGGTERTMDPADYRLIVRPETVSRIVPAFGKSWPFARADEAVITIDFVAGWADAAAVPEAVKQAIRFSVGHYYQSREETVIGATVATLPAASEQLLFPYRVFP